MYEVITILVCVISRIAALWSSHRINNKFKEYHPKPYTPTANPEIEALNTKKKEIEDTMEQFNSPSTFAKYSKMQRELIKIEKQVAALTQKQQQEEQASRQQHQKEEKQRKEKAQSERQAQVRRTWMTRGIVHFALIIMLHKYSTLPLSLAQEYPLSLLADQEGRLPCSLLFFGCTMLLS